jgi:hypothetical protein
VGGFGSGRQSSGSRYLAAEQCYSLDLACLARSGYLAPGVKATGSRQWFATNDPEEITGEAGVTIDLRDLAAPTFTISYVAGGVPLEIHGRLLTTRPQLGGVRYWFGCPRCGMRRRVLYAYPARGRERFACRRCHGLRYYSHREGAADRSLRRARTLYRRIGGHPDQAWYEKPKWMRWKTFDRILEEAHAAATRADVLHFYGLSMPASLRGHFPGFEAERARMLAAIGQTAA